MTTQSSINSKSRELSALLYPKQSKSKAVTNHNTKVKLIFIINNKYNNQNIDEAEEGQIRRIAEGTQQGQNRNSIEIEQSCTVVNNQYTIRILVQVYKKYSIGIHY